MQFVLYEDESRNNFLPFTYTRPVYELRVGIDTLREKWEYFLGKNSVLSCEKHLFPLFGKLPGDETDFTFVNSRFIPNIFLEKNIRSLKSGELLVTSENEVLAFRIKLNHSKEIFQSVITRSFINRLNLKTIFLKNNKNIPILKLLSCPDIFRINGAVLREDYKRIVKKRKSQSIKDKHTILYNRSQIFLEKGAVVRAAILNAENGPIYLGNGSVVEEGSVIRGPFALGEKAHVLMGAKIRGDSTIGPGCKVGGEVSNSVFFSNSNKAHDGFIGNSVVGEWCNLGAGTTISNLKNNYSTIKRWDIATNKFVDSGLQFCGLMMGDHSKSGIQTMFNTGTVTGVGANIFGAGFPPKYIPSFSWGGAEGFETFKPEKFLELAKKVMERRSVTLRKEHVDLLMHVFKMTND